MNYELIFYLFFYVFLSGIWGGYGDLIPNGDGDGESPIIFIGDWGGDGDEK